MKSPIGFGVRHLKKRRYYTDKDILLIDLGKAIDQFEKAMKLPTNDDVVRAGCIQYFEFCFELAWKTVKKIAHDLGVQECNSPKSALKFAFSGGWLDEEEVWLNMLASRNMMSHTYNAADALKIYDKLPRFVEAIRQLEQFLKKME